MKPDFRHVLRQKTRDDHDRLDHLISTLDIRQRRGFRAFLQLHLNCFSKMQTLQAGQCNSRAALNDLVSKLKKDLRAISAKATDSTAILPPSMDPLAIDYIVSGSRLGTNVLSKIWVRSDDPLVRNADSYFGQVSDIALWQETCRALSDIPIDSPRADEIVADTRLLFQLFVTVFSGMDTDQDALV